MSTPTELRQAIHAIAALVNDLDCLTDAIRVLATGIGASRAPAQERHQPLVSSAPEARTVKVPQRKVSTLAVKIEPELLDRVSAFISKFSKSRFERATSISNPTITRLLKLGTCSPDTLDRLKSWDRKGSSSARPSSVRELYIPPQATTDEAEPTHACEGAYDNIVAEAEFNRVKFD
jgi:hypothetical protein